MISPEASRQDDIVVVAEASTAFGSCDVERNSLRDSILDLQGPSGIRRCFQDRQSSTDRPLLKN